MGNDVVHSHRVSTTFHLSEMNKWIVWKQRRMVIYSFSTPSHISYKVVDVVVYIFIAFNSATKRQQQWKVLKRTSIFSIRITCEKCFSVIVWFDGAAFLSSKCGCRNVENENYTEIFLRELLLYVYKENVMCYIVSSSFLGTWHSRKELRGHLEKSILCARKWCSIYRMIM